MKKFFLILLIFIAGFLLLTYKITEVPPGINGDEAGIGYNAMLISRNFTDENGNFFPLFIFAKDSDWKQPVTVYTTALLFKIFGVSFFVLRATSVFFVFLSIIVLFFLSKAYGGLAFFLSAALILITTPIIMIQSHLALENIAPIPFILFWILMLMKFERQTRLLFVFWGGVALGLGAFSYYGMRLVVPVLAFLTIYYLRKNLRAVKFFLVGFLPFLLLLLIAYFRYPGAIFGNFEAPPPTVYEFLHRYLSTFDLSFLFFVGDKIAYHSTGIFGVFLLPTLPLFTVGAYRIIRNKKPLLLLILLSFFLAPLLYGLVPEFYRASRLLAIVPIYAMISSIGLMSLRKTFAICMLVSIGVSYFMFAYDYWYEYPKRVKQTFPIHINSTSDFRVKE